VHGLTNVSVISAGGYHCLFLKDDSTVWACGWNDYGQLGDSTNIDRNVPVQLYGLDLPTPTATSTATIDPSASTPDTPSNGLTNMPSMTPIENDRDNSWMWVFLGLVVIFGVVFVVFIILRFKNKSMSIIGC